MMRRRIQRLPVSDESVRSIERPTFRSGQVIRFNVALHNKDDQRQQDRLL